VSAATFFSIGHSTRPLDEFLEILRGAQVTQLADVRAFPYSRRFPQFDGSALARTLAAEGGDETKAAKRLGLSKTVLQKKTKEN